MDFRAALLEQTRAFGDLIRRRDPCDARSDLSGTGRSSNCSAMSDAETVGPHRSSSTAAASRWTRATSATAGRPRTPTPPSTGSTTGAQLIIDAVDRVGSDARVWTFIGPRPAGLVDPPAAARGDRAPRRRGAGARCRLRPGAGTGRRRDQRMGRADVAVDKRRRRPLDAGATLHLHATDDGAGPDRRVDDRPRRGRGVVVARPRQGRRRAARARRRTSCWRWSGGTPRPTRGVEVFGDAAVWDGWLERTPF